MVDKNRPTSAIYAGLDDDSNSTVAISSAEQDSSGGNELSGSQGGSYGSSHSSPDGSNDQKPKSRGKRKPIAVAAIAIICLALIGVSSFALMGGFDSMQTAGATQEDATGEDTSISTDEDTNETQSGETTTATGQDEEQGNTSSSSSNSSSSGSSGSTSSGSSSSSGNSGTQANDYIVVTVSIDSSAVGSPVSLLTTVKLEPDSTVYDALLATGISVSARTTAFGIYVASIGGLAEDPSQGINGWTYYVNGSYINTSANKCTVSDGDAVSWVYVTS